MVEFILNNKTIRTNKPSGSLLLDFIRYDSGMTGTKIGCREGDCGACMVLIGSLKNGLMQYRQVTSCLTPIGNAHGKQVVSIEGLNMSELSPVQHYMVETSGTQCGFCTIGFVVSLTAFCLSNKTPNYKDAIAAIDGNICRCTGYKSIERAAQHICNALANKDTQASTQWLVDQKFIPNYFLSIPKRLVEIGVSKDDKTGEITVGGGTDLYVQRHDELIDKDVNLITQIPDLTHIKLEKGVFTLGGGCTVTDLEESDLIATCFPRLAEHIKLVSSSPIRNMSTLAGNFVNASPIGDFTAFFLALNTKITLSSHGNSRTIFLKDLYKGYKDLDKTNEEIITSLSFKAPDENNWFNLEKVSKRTHLDIASVNTAAQISVKNDHFGDIHISAGGVGPIPIYLEKTCKYLKDQPIRSSTIKAANDILQTEISPISDVRGTAAYKRLLLRQLFYAHFIKLFPDQFSLNALTA